MVAVEAAFLPLGDCRRVPRNRPRGEAHGCWEIPATYRLIDPRTAETDTGFDFLETEETTYLCSVLDAQGTTELFDHLFFPTNKAKCSAVFHGLVRAVEDCSGSLALCLIAAELPHRRRGNCAISGAGFANCSRSTTAIRPGNCVGLFHLREKLISQFLAARKLQQGVPGPAWIHPAVTLPIMRGQPHGDQIRAPERAVRSRSLLALANAG